MSTLFFLEKLVEDGRIVCIYRELRNSLEEFCEAVFFDILAINEIKDFESATPFEPPDRSWFKKASNVKGGVLKNLKKDLENCFDEAINHYENELPISKSEVWNRLYENLNTPLFLAAASTDQEVSPQGLEKLSEEVRNRAEETVEKILRQLKKEEILSEEEKELARKILKDITPSSSPVYIKFPSGSLARQLSVNIFPKKI